MGFGSWGFKSPLRHCVVSRSIVDTTASPELGLLGGSWMFDELGGRRVRNLNTGCQVPSDLLYGAPALCQPHDLPCEMPSPILYWESIYEPRSSEQDAEHHSEEDNETNDHKFHHEQECRENKEDRHDHENHNGERSQEPTEAFVEEGKRVGEIEPVVPTRIPFVFFLPSGSQPPPARRPGEPADLDPP